MEGCFVQAKSIEELQRLMKESIYLYYSNEKDFATDYNQMEDIKLELSYA